MKYLTLIILSAQYCLGAFAQSEVPDSVLERLNPFVSFWEHLPDGTEITSISLSWPSDDVLCDQYDGSDGHGSYTLYKTQSGKIMGVTAYGAYCQGDSEYGYQYWFDKDGNPTYYEDGNNIYTAERIVLFDKAQSIVEVVYPSHYDSGDHLRTISWGDSTEEYTADYFGVQFEALREEMRNRAETLKEMMPTLEKAEQKAEAAQLITELWGKVMNPDTAKLVLRQITPEDVNDELFIRIKTLTPVYKTPSIHSEVIGSFDYYDIFLFALKAEQGKLSGGQSQNDWYYIRWMDPSSDEDIEGWIPGSAIARDLFPSN